MDRSGEAANFDDQRLSAEAVLIGGGVPEHGGLVMREDACAVVGPFGTGGA